METNPYIQVIDSPNKLGRKKNYNAIFGLQLISCPAEREDLHKEEFLIKYLNLQMDFINSIYHSVSNRVYALRYISRPCEISISRGVIEIALFFKISHSDSKQVIQEAQKFASDLRLLILGLFPNHHWRWLDKKNFHQFWMPFDFSKCYFVEIRRREDLIHRETMKPRPSLGRGRSTRTYKWNEQEAIYFVHNFIPQPTTLARMLRLFLLHKLPLIFQINLMPTGLNKSEEETLLKQIAQCEMGKKNQNIPLIITESIHHRHSRALAELLLNQLLRLQDAPFMMNIYLVSPAPIPQTLVESVGIEITQPVGLSQEGEIPTKPLFLQMGGYDVLSPKNKKEQENVLNNIKNLTFELWGKHLAPRPLKRIRFLVDALEAAGAFRFPIATTEGLPGIPVTLNRPQPLPREIAQLNEDSSSSKHLFLGVNHFLGKKENVYCKQSDRLQHIYVVGQTGTGKTTLLKNMILSDIFAGHGVAVIDPHGDLFDELLTYIPEDRIQDVVILDPNDAAYPVGINVLEYHNPAERYHIIREFKAIIKKQMEDEYGSSAWNMTGPIFYQHLQMNLLLSMSNPQDPGTLLEFIAIFSQKEFWKKWVPPVLKDVRLENWINYTLPKVDYLSASRGETSLGDYIRSKFEDFVFDPRLRLIFGQKKSTISFRQIMDEGKILLINLAKGELSEENSKFLGMFIMSKIVNAAMSRVDIPKKKRKTFYLYVDEFQSIATQNFTILLSEARKFGISLVLANQFISQIKDPRIIEALFGNVGTIISFRVGIKDAKEYLAPHFYPYADALDLTSLPNWRAYIKTNVDGKGIAPFLLQTVLPKVPKNESRVKQVRENSRMKFSCNRSAVEKEIEKSLSFNPPSQELTEFENF